MFKIQRAMDRKQASLDLSEASLYSVPPHLKLLPDLSQITDINLSHNQLFNGEGRAGGGGGGFLRDRSPDGCVYVM